MRIYQGISILLMVTTGVLPMDDGVFLSVIGNICHPNFGYPTPSDCVSAIDKLTISVPNSDHLNQMPRFLHHPRCPACPGAYNELVPQTVTAGDCSIIIAVQPSSGVDASQWWDVASRNDLKDAATTANTVCVRGRSFGGQVTSGQRGKLAVQMYGPGSKIDEVYQALRQNPGSNILSDIPMGVSSETLLEAKICWQVSQADASYADDHVYFSSTAKSILMYGVSTLQSMSPCS